MRKMMVAVALLAMGTRAGWRTFVVDSTGHYGSSSSIALAKDGSVHVAAYDGGKYKTFYFTLKGGHWSKADLGYTTEYSSMAADTAGGVHLAFIQGGDSAHLLYGRDTGDGMRITAVNSTYHYYWIPCMALDRAGAPHMSAYVKWYADGTSPARDLYYATRGNDGAWTGQDLDSSDLEVGKYSALAFDTANRPHIAYIDVSQGRLLYIHRADTGWARGTVGDGNWTQYGHFVHMLFPADGKPHLAFERGDSDYICHAYPDSAGHWTVKVLDSTHEYSFSNTIGFAQGPDGELGISYRNGGTRSLNFARVKGASATVEKVDSLGNTGYSTALTANARGDYYLSYIDSAGVLRLATTDPDFAGAPPVSARRAPRARAPGLRPRGHALELRAPGAAELEVELLDPSGRAAFRRGPERFAAGIIPLPASLRAGMYVAVVRSGGRALEAAPLVVAGPEGAP